jgi:anti-anti-sigma factor
VDISTAKTGDQTEVRATGRLDGTWADHLSRALEELLRQGNDRVQLNMAAVEYVSSLGLRVLINAHKNFRAVNGSFIVTEPSVPVRRVIEMAGLKALLVGTAPRPQAATAAPSATPAELRNEALTGQVYALPGRGMSARTFGNPAQLAGGGYSAADCSSLPLRVSSVSVGLGAFGHSFEECRGRFGEFLTLAGAGVYQPSDGSNACDSLLTTGDYVPELQALYGVECAGEFTHLLRFEPASVDGSVPLSELASFALEVAGTPAACLVIAAESAGLIGASLRRSPGEARDAVDPFAFPGAREWLSFTAEAAHQRMSVVAGGVIARPGSETILAPLLRPLAAASGPLGHIHAATFRFHPLQRGPLQLATAVRPWFEHDVAESVMHLLADDREPGPAVESRFTRGACWIAPLGTGANL